MPNRALHAALREFCLDTAAILTQCVRGGDELGFDLIEERGRASLYHYRPRTAEYIGGHWVKLRSLASFEGAVKAVEPAAAAYAQIRGLGAKGGEPVLRDVVERLYEDATDFGFPEQRFELIAEELGENVGESAVRAVVIGRVHGVHLASPAIGLDDQLALAGGHAVQELPPALMDGDECLTPPEVVCVFAVEQDGAAELPVAEARTRFRRLLTGLRLMGAAGARIDSLGWTRAGQGSLAARLARRGRIRPARGVAASPGLGGRAVRPARRAGPLAPLRAAELGAGPVRDGLLPAAGDRGALRPSARDPRPAGRHAPRRGPARHAPGRALRRARSAGRGPAPGRAGARAGAPA